MDLIPSPLPVEQALGQKFLLSFYGLDGLPDEILPVVRRVQPAGFTLYRSLNLSSPDQVRKLTASLQATARQLGLPPFLLATDQEGGQLLAMGDPATAFPGNLALGAAGSEDLARRTGVAIGRELAAVGININYAPVCDLLTNAHNTSLGTRSFGDDPTRVARLASALAEGLQSVGVAATAKHFPGYGEVTIDAHHATPVLSLGLERLRTVELPPFQAALSAGVRLVMTGHMALPFLNDGLELPATLSPRLLKEVLRQEMSYSGLIVTDALDMGAIEQGDGLLIDSLAAFSAGVDLLLFGPGTTQGARLQAGLMQAVRRGLLNADEIQASAERVRELKQWLSGFEQPDLDVVGCREHLELALETARRSVTCVRDRNSLLPLQPGSQQPWLALTPTPADLTPAETSSTVPLALSDALHLGGVPANDLPFSVDLTETEIQGLLEASHHHAGVLVGTFNAIDHPSQIDLLSALAETNLPVIAVALRSPFDLSVYPEVGTCLCTYNIQPVSIQALGEALWGLIPFHGILPVKIPVE